MPGLPPAVRVPSCVRPFLLGIALIALLSTAPSASAAIHHVPTERMVGCTNAKIDDRGSGQIDANGNLYVPCRYLDGVDRPNIRVYDVQNRWVRTILVPALPNANDPYIADVAPNGDGSVLYVTQRKGYAFFKLVRQADGTYARDAAWALEKFRDPVAGLVAPRGEYISADDAGNLYIANGLWVGGPYAYLKYGPDGKFVTRFGQYKADSWALDDIYWQPGGIAALRDGSAVYTTETGNNRLVRWEQQFDGSYRAVRSWGGSAATDPKRWGSCMDVRMMAAPYDVSIDAAGYAYVINATCGALGTERTEVHRIRGNQVDLVVSPKLKEERDAQGRLLQPGQYSLQHAIAVAADGTIYVPSVSAIMRAPGAEQVPLPEPLPEPDPLPQPVDPVPPPPAVNTAPQLRQVTLPNPAQHRQVQVAIDALDDVAVAEMRLATEAGVWGAWQPFAATTTFALTPGAGNRGVFVQVRDAARLESNTVYRTTVSSGIDAPPAGEPAPEPDPEPVPIPNPQPNPAVDVAPTLRGVTLPAQTAVREIQVAIDALDDVAVTEMRLATESGVWAEWQPFAATTTFTLTAGVGTRGVFVQVRDAKRQESATLYRTTKLLEQAPAPAPVPAPNPEPVPAPQPNPDPVPVPALVDAAAPVLRAVTLPAQSTTRAIIVAVDATDDVAVTEVRLANEDGTWSAWQPYAANVPWVLTRIAMTKGVFVQVRDAARRESNKLYRTMLCAAPCSDPPAAGALRAKKLGAAKAVRVALRRGTMRADRVRGGRSSDHYDISQDDRKRDVLDCGAGRDTALVRPGDVTRNCEVVRVVRVPR